METVLLVVITIMVAALLYITTKNSKPQGGTFKVLLDTSALIDGRVVDIVASGFLAGTLIVPQFVLDELQGLADGSDSLKRERARYGLDNVKALQESRRVEVEITDQLTAVDDEVDAKLVNLSLSLNAYLLTTDFNLMKVADIRGVDTMNINELSQAIRTPALPGEVITIGIVQKGSGRDQGVGYLSDGTMVVVGGAGSMKGKEVEAEVTRTLQTAAGRMLFAESKTKPEPQKSRRTHRAAKSEPVSKSGGKGQGRRGSQRRAS